MDNKVPAIQNIINNKIHCAIQMPLDNITAINDISQYTSYHAPFFYNRKENGESYCIYFKDGTHSGWDLTSDVIKSDIPIYDYYDVFRRKQNDIKLPFQDFAIGDYVFDTVYHAYGYIKNMAYYDSEWHYMIKYVSPVEDDWGDQILGNVSLAKEIESVEFAKIEKEDEIMAFDYIVNSGYRIDKSNNTKIPTKTTRVFLTYNCRSGEATCDEEDYDKRTGILNAIANAVCNGNFDKEYEKILKREKDAHKWLCTCGVCGKVYESKEEADACEIQHIENKKARRQRYLERKEARDRIAAAEREGRINALMQQMLAEGKK